MVEVKLNFDKINLVPIVVKEVEIDGRPLNFICEAEKMLNKKGNTLVISNAIATNLIPSNDRVSIHVVSLYRNITNGEDVTVHERTYGEIESVENTMGNSANAPSAYEIVIEDVDLFDYTMEVKTEHEKLEDKIEELKNELEREVKRRVGQVKELQDSIERQAKEFKEFKDRIHKAFGVGNIHIDNSGVTSAFTLTSIKNHNQ